jgi:hypothetical protein
VSSSAARWSQASRKVSIAVRDRRICGQGFPGARIAGSVRLCLSARCRSGKLQSSPKCFSTFYAALGSGILCGYARHALRKLGGQHGRSPCEGRFPSKHCNDAALEPPLARFRLRRLNRAVPLTPGGRDVSSGFQKMSHTRRSPVLTLSIVGDKISPISAEERQRTMRPVQEQSFTVALVRSPGISAIRQGH